MEVAACEAHKLAEAYIEQEELVEAGNTLFATEPPIQSDEVNDEVDIEDPEVDIVTKAPEAPEVNIATMAPEAPEVNIATVAPEALEAGNATAVDLTTNITTELSIQSNEVLLNQATAPHRQGTRVRQPTKRAAEAEALRQRKRSRRA